MSAPKKRLVPFDAAHYLTDEASIAAYLDAVLESADPDLLLLALGDVARARGMTDVARKAGLGRESLYKALTPGAQPRLPTVMKVFHALGLRLRVEALGDSATQSV
jgi:probable addiction module antidote protein